jgi:hypothetical protein
MACAARNARQVRPDRRGAGSTPVSWRICHTVDGATLYPKPASSPWMRRWGDDLAQLAEMTAGQRPDQRGRERPVARDPAAAARFWSTPTDL